MSLGPFTALAQIEGLLGGDHPDVMVDITIGHGRIFPGIQFSTREPHLWVHLNDRETAKLAAISLRHLLGMGALREFTVVASDGHIKLDVDEFFIKHLGNP
jgi:hypothetical protein